MRRFFHSQINFLLFGFVFWLPVVILLYVLFLFFSNAGNTGKAILSAVLPETLVYPGFGIILVILIVYFSGFILKATKVRGVVLR